MRNKRLINALDWDAHQVQFPKYNYAFQQFRTKLGEAVLANFDYTVAKTLEYDEDAQLFWVTFTRSNPLPKGPKEMPTLVEVKRSYRIDPTQSLELQFQEMLRVQRHVEETFNLLYTMYEDHKCSR